MDRSYENMLIPRILHRQGLMPHGFNWVLLGLALWYWWARIEREAMTVLAVLGGIEAAYQLLRLLRVTARAVWAMACWVGRVARWDFNEWLRAVREAEELRVKERELAENARQRKEALEAEQRKAEEAERERANRPPPPTIAELIGEATSAFEMEMATAAGIKVEEARDLAESAALGRYVKRIRDLSARNP